MKSHSPANACHCFQVAQCAERISGALRLSPDTAEVVTRAALLHDVGKMCFPARLLNPVGLQFFPERRLMATLHPEIGYQLLEVCATTQAEAVLVRHHHDHFDGSNGLRGNAIPIGSRIIAAADAYVHWAKAAGADCLVDRKAVEYVKMFAGLKFDPQIVEALETSLPHLHPVPKGIGV